MKPQDIEKIADSVIGAFARPTQASAGCAGISDPTAFNCPVEQGDFSCLDNYDCGGAGAFKCGMTLFTCEGGDFSCSALYSE